MKNLVFLLFLAVLGFAVAGYFLGWYQITGLPSGDGQRRLQIDINTAKIKDDLDRGGNKLQDGISRVKDGAEKAKDVAKQEVPGAAKPTKHSESSFFEFLDRIGEKSSPKR